MCHDCVSRRGFVAMAAGGAAAAALAACGDGRISGLAEKVNTIGSDGSNTVTAKVGDYPGLAATGNLVMIANSFVAAKRTGATTFDALYMGCTHQGCLTNIVSNAFKCPCHFSQFDNDGKVIAGPAQHDLIKLPASYDPATDILKIN